jgi:hypothetical protein
MGHSEGGVDQSSGAGSHMESCPTPVLCQSDVLTELLQLRQLASAEEHPGSDGIVNQ